MTTVVTSMVYTKHTNIPHRKNWTVHLISSTGNYFKLILHEHTHTTLLTSPARCMRADLMNWKMSTTPSDFSFSSWEWMQMKVPVRPTPSLNNRMCVGINIRTAGNEKNTLEWFQILQFYQTMKHNQTPHNSYCYRPILIIHFHALWLQSCVTYIHNLHGEQYMNLNGITATLTCTLQ